jgi:aryl-alcohol dehydrogenase-like predicted oxidoreductase
VRFWFLRKLETFQALRQLPRDKIQLATKFGLLLEVGGLEVCGRPDYVRRCCEASLKRLGVDYIDLYYQHRIDKLVPIEDTVCASLMYLFSL